MYSLFQFIDVYRAEKKYLQILLSRAQAGPGRKVKQEQEESSRNHVPRLFLGSVLYCSAPDIDVTQGRVFFRGKREGEKHASDKRKEDVIESRLLSMPCEEGLCLSPSASRLNPFHVGQVSGRVQR